MDSLLVLVMLVTTAAGVEDLSGKMFTFPQQGKTAYVKLTTTKQELRTVTVCHRTFTDLKRSHSLFSLSTPSNSNDFLIFWDQSTEEMAPHIRDTKVGYKGLDYKVNMWHSICTTWDSTTGLTQVWFNGRPTIRKFTSASRIRGSMNIILGQEQDSHGGGFDINQSFVGMIMDVHVWDYVLSSCEIQSYRNNMNFTPGNVINWKALSYQIIDRVILENSTTACQQQLVCSPR